MILPSPSNKLPESRNPELDPSFCHLWAWVGRKIPILPPQFFPGSRKLWASIVTSQAVRASFSPFRLELFLLKVEIGGTGGPERLFQVLDSFPARNA